MNEERNRLDAANAGTAPWRLWGPYVAERAWGTVREDYSADGDAGKDYWFYLDNVPGHAYMRALYKYPHKAFPYERLRSENRKRGRNDPEFELIDTGVFDENRYFDVAVDYAKAAPTDLLIRI